MCIIPLGGGERPGGGDVTGSGGKQRERTGERGRREREGSMVEVKKGEERAGMADADVREEPQRFSRLDDGSAAAEAELAVEAQANEVRRLKQAGLNNRHPAVVAAVAELKRLRALVRPEAALAREGSARELCVRNSSIADEPDADLADFLLVRKNRDACIHWLLTFAQRIERTWCACQPCYMFSSG